MGNQSRIREERRQRNADRRGPGDRKVDFGAPENGARYGLWAVAFLDLLGFSEELMATDILPPPPKAEALEMFRNLVNRRLSLLAGPKVTLDAIASVNRTEAAKASAAEKKLQELFGKVRVATSGFSDCVFLETLLEGVDKAPMKALSDVVVATTLQVVSHLAMNSPIRAGIDIAPGMWILDHVHTAAKAKAVALEKCAGYPRILVGDRFRAYLSEALEGRDDPTPMGIHRRLAEVLNSFLFSDPLDPPGYPSGIDFLGKPFKDVVPVDEEMVKRIWRFAQESRDRFRKENRPKEQAKYERLVAYVESRLPIWNLDKSSPR
jgi:hypothetical protein